MAYKCVPARLSFATLLMCFCALDDEHDAHVLNHRFPYAHARFSPFRISIRCSSGPTTLAPPSFTLRKSRRAFPRCGRQADSGHTVLATYSMNKNRGGQVLKRSA